MKFLVVCMFALVTTSMAGESKKGKRGLLGLYAHALPAASALPVTQGLQAVDTLPLAHTFQAAPALPVAHHEFNTISSAPLVESHQHLTHIPLNAAHEIHASPLVAQAAPLAQVSAHGPIVDQFNAAHLVHATHRLISEHTHTHTVEKVNVPVPYTVEKTIVKHIPIDRPVPQYYPVEVIKKIPQPYHVDKLVPQPYPVHVKVAVPKPYVAPVDRVQTVVEKVPVQQAYHVQAPVYAQHQVAVQHQPALAIQQHIEPAAFAFQATPPLAQPFWTQSFASHAGSQEHLGQSNAFVAAAPSFDLHEHQHASVPDAFVKHY